MERQEFRGSKPGERRGGRAKGTPNKTTAALKEAVLIAAMEAGQELRDAAIENLRAANDAVNQLRAAGLKGQDGLVFYLKQMALGRLDNSAPFAGLLGKVLPLTLAGDVDNPLTLQVTRIERVMIPSNNRIGDAPIPIPFRLAFRVPLKTFDMLFKRAAHHPRFWAVGYGEDLRIRPGV